MQAFMLLMLATTANAASQLCLKHAASRTMSDGGGIYLVVVRLLQSPHFIGGLVLFAVSISAYGYLLSLYDITIVFPAMSLTYVGVLYLCWRFLGERISRLRATGAALITMGIVLLAAGTD